MSAAADLVVRAARNAARVRLKPADYVERFGPPPHVCTGCSHRKPDEHDAGGRLDRLVLVDIAAKASWAPATWGEGAWPSVPRIARRIGYCDRSVQYALRRLVASGFLELVERPGRTNLFRILRPVEPLGTVDGEDESVDNVGDNRPPVDPPDLRAVAPGGATVAPELGHLPTDQPLKAPVRGLGESDRAVARAQSPRPNAAAGGDPPPAAAGPLLARVGAEPHRRMRGGRAVAEPAPSSLDDLAAVLSAAETPATPAGEADPASGQHWSREAARQLRRCPRCAAPPGEACRNRKGRLRKANHAERRIPNVYGPAADAGAWRAPGDGPEF